MLRKTGQYILGLLFIALVVELLLLSPADLDEKKVNEPPRDLKTNYAKDIEQVMEGIHVIESRSESKEWELWADTAMGFKDQANMQLQKIKAMFFSDNGTSFEVTGDKGQVMTNAKNIKVDGQVVTTSSNGYVFKSESLSYNSASRQLTSPNAVEVTGPREQGGQTLFLSGRDMSADLEKGIVKIGQDVIAKKTLSGNRRMAVSSERVEMSGKHKSVRFTGEVLIDLNGVKIRGPDALFRYDSDDGQLESIDLEGGVRVQDVSKWATSEKLSINLAKNEFVFDGKPRVVQDNDELRGDRIIFLDGGKQVRVQNAKIKVSKESLGADKSATDGVGKGR
jgi:LPS export ABC transporter protein LptC